MTLRIHPEANGEVTEALAWLIRKHRPNVAARLWRFWLAGLDAIEANPLLSPIADDSPSDREVRNYLLPRYGYRIVYEATPTGLIVLAFARGRRRQGHWLPRLDPS